MRSVMHMMFVLLVASPSLVAARSATPRTGYLVAERFALQKSLNGVDGTLELLRDDRLTAVAVREMWGVASWDLAFSPSDHLYKEFSEAPPLKAKLVIRNVKGELLEGRLLDEPLARLKMWNPPPGDTQFFLLTQDYSIGFGSYNGPITGVLQVSNGAFHDVKALNVKSHRENPIHVMKSLKFDWRITRRGDEILSISCHMESDDHFVIDYTRYALKGSEWFEYTRQERGTWESGERFPPRSKFP